MDPIIPNEAQREAIEKTAMSGSGLCWTCGTCDSECPVYLYTGRLRPQIIVRMANLGMLDELMALPQIWYCLGCRRCGTGCPNQVKPFELTRYLRNTLLCNSRDGAALSAALRKLMGNFQRVRYRSILRAMHNEQVAISEREWYQWLEKPIRNSIFKEIELGVPTEPLKAELPHAHSPRVCLSCSECSNCCPIFHERSIFDPQHIIRMSNLGLTGELLKSPSIWMCLGCRRCAQTCSQLVSGYDVIRRLRLLAVERGEVDPHFPSRLLELERLIYPRLLDEIDHLVGMFGLQSGR